MIKILLLTTALVTCQTIKAQNTTELKIKIENIIVQKEATTAVTILAADGNELVSINGNMHCPMQSVFKFHIALAVLSKIDQGYYTLNQQIEILKSELQPGLWSPLREENPNGGKFTIGRLIQYAVSESDNVACDVLIKLAGGPLKVSDYIKKNGIADIAIAFNEADMQKKWDNMFQNWTTTNAACLTLKTFFTGKNQILSANSHNFIWQTMKQTHTGEERLKGLLPKGTIVAHKTGTSGTNKAGVTAAINDIGIVFLPNGSYFFISVFVTNTKEPYKTNAQIIAQISKAAFDYFTP
jgi:beta-lactamase class A